MIPVIAALLAVQAAPAAAPTAQPPRAEAQKPAAKPEKPFDPTKPLFQPTEVKSTGSVTVGGRRIPYRAVAGTLVVHSKDWSDTDPIEAGATKKSDKDDDLPKAEASMFYAAYFRDGAPSANRPITFMFNGGPGSSTVWLHMGAFGPVRVQALDQRHTPAPYSVVNNDQSLLDATDLVFIDAPGTGFSRIAGKDKEKAFYGVDQDIDAFAQFITQFLSKYGRWNSPKYVFGESYGTMRGAGLALALQKRDVDLNGADPAVGHPQLGSRPRRPAAESRHRFALRRLAADLCGDRLVSQSRRQSPRRPAELPLPGRSLCD